MHDDRLNVGTRLGCSSDFTRSPSPGVSTIPTTAWPPACTWTCSTVTFGIADAANLSWMMAAALSGWAQPAILDAYQAERQPVADQVSRLTEDSASRARTQHREIPAEIEWPGQIGEAMRARIGREAYELAVQRQCAGGLNFGYFYEGSPIIAYDGEPHPPYTMRDFTSSTVPGCHRTCGSVTGARSTTRSGRDTHSSGSTRP
jgi:hypothetical protein